MQKKDISSSKLANAPKGLTPSVNLLATPIIFIVCLKKKRFDAFPCKMLIFMTDFALKDTAHNLAFF